jgi:hypothetical protein
VRLSDGTFVAPQASWAAQRVSGTSIYHLGMQSLGSDADRVEWGGDLGLAQEEYLLEQFRQLEPRATVYPEILFTRSGSQAKTVDVIVVTPELVLLVESKSLRVRLDSITASAAYLARLKRDLDHAFGTQLARTAAMIRDRHVAVAHIPDDRPVIGLVATPEPLHLANRRDYRASIADPTIPTLVASLTQIEQLIAVTLRDTDSSVFASAAAADQHGNVDVDSVLRTAFGNDRPVNPLIDQAWAAGRWPTEP